MTESSLSSEIFTGCLSMPILRVPPEMFLFLLHVLHPQTSGVLRSFCASSDVAAFSSQCEKQNIRGVVRLVKNSLAY
jgi:hypothetical protein